MAPAHILLCLAVVACAIPLEVSLQSAVIKLDPTIQTYDVGFSLTNTHNTPLILLKWNTPLDKLYPFPADMFYIRPLQDEKSPVYIGIAQKRFLVASDLVTIQPNETFQVSINLLDGYWFPSLGEHEVFFSAPIFVHEGLKEEVDLSDFESIPVSSAPISVIITSLAPTPNLLTHSNNSLETISAFTNCDSNLQTQSRTADQSSNSIVGSVITYLSGISCSSTATQLQRYVTWFGTCDANRLKTVATNYNNIRNRINSGYRMTCNTGCSSGVYAYVYPSDNTFTVYVCSGYINAGNCNTDSKAGTIVHEISHFTPVAGTSDHAYGQANCRNLASTNPARAIQNADNYEYMAESYC